MFDERPQNLNNLVHKSECTDMEGNKCIFDNNNESCDSECLDKDIVYIDIDKKNIEKEEFQKLLDEHDFYYFMSKDINVVNKGKESFNNIQLAMYDNGLFRRMYDKINDKKMYCQEGNHG